MSIYMKSVYLTMLNMLDLTDSHINTIFMHNVDFKSDP